MPKALIPAATRSVQHHAPIDVSYAIRNLVRADFHARYRTTAAGALWSLINPVIMMGVLTFVFSVIFESGRELFPLFLLAGLLPFDFFSQAWLGGTNSVLANAALVKSFPFRAELLPNPVIMMGVLTFVFSVIFESGRELFPLFLLAGLLPFDFFSQAWLGGTNSVLANAALVKSFPFRAELLPISAVLGSFVHYLIQLSFLLLAFAWFVGFNIYWLWLPVIVALQVLFACGFALASAALNVRYRDVLYVVESGTLVVFWMVPIFYGLDQVSPQYTWLYDINPVAAVVVVMRRVLLYGVDPGYTLLKLLGVSVLCFAGGYLLFQHHRRDFADYL